MCTLKFSLITSPLKGTGNTGGKDTYGKTAKINSHRYISTHCVLDFELRSTEWKQDPVLQEAHPSVEVTDVS